MLIEGSGDSDKSFARGAVGGFSGGLGTMPLFSSFHAVGSGLVQGP